MDIYQDFDRKLENMEPHQRGDVAFSLLAMVSALHKVEPNPHIREVIENSITTLMETKKSKVHDYEDYQNQIFDAINKGD